MIAQNAGNRCVPIPLKGESALEKDLYTIQTPAGQVLASGCWIADRFFPRLCGLLGKKALAEGEALLIYPCNMVHSLGMRFTIDVVFLDAKFTVVYLLTGLKPNRIGPLVREARYALELPAGTVPSDLQTGDVLICK